MSCVIDYPSFLSLQTSILLQLKLEVELFKRWVFPAIHKSFTKFGYSGYYECT